jgi:hypothetical protein
MVGKPTPIENGAGVWLRTSVGSARIVMIEGGLGGLGNKVIQPLVIVALAKSMALKAARVTDFIASTPQLRQEASTGSQLDFGQFVGPIGQTS